MKTPNRQSGFTLVEILVAVAIFMLAMLIATSVFMVATMHQRQTAAGQALQSDIRYALESVVRDVKYGTIDYDFYSNGTCMTGATNYCSNDPNNTTCPTNPCIVNLNDATQNPVRILGVRDTDGNMTRYRVDTTSDRLMVCTITIATDSLSRCDDMTSTNWAAVTPDTVEMQRGEFYLFPLADPIALSGSASGSPYKADDQPRVTIVLKTVQRYPNGGVQQFITAQSTATSRLYAR